MDLVKVAAGPTPLTDSDRVLIKRKLQELVDRDGKPTPEAFLKLAEPETSPLHRFFTWDDQQAAHQMRLLQARQLVRTVTLEVVRIDSNHRSVKIEVRPTDAVGGKQADSGRLPPMRESQPDRSRGKVRELAERIEEAVRDAGGTMEIFEELRWLRQMAKRLHDKAPYEGKRCSKCGDFGHAPGSQYCSKKSAGEISTARADLGRSFQG